MLEMGGKWPSISSCLVMEMGYAGSFVGEERGSQLNSGKEALVKTCDLDLDLPIVDKHWKNQSHLFPAPVRKGQ
jgi:hypothetical protein